MKQFVSYTRVSTQRQGQSGLGLEAQRKMIADYITVNSGTLIQEYTEVTSGMGKTAKNRGELMKAIAHCKATNSTLCVAKLDRLSRNVSFLLAVVDSGVDITFTDFQCQGIAGRMILIVMSALAQYEGQVISQRTRDALAAAKARGTVLGNPNLQHAKAAAASVIARKASIHTTNNVVLKGRVERMRVVESKSYTDIADTLNTEGLRSTRGHRFSEHIIKRILKTPV